MRGFDRHCLVRQLRGGSPSRPLSPNIVVASPTYRSHSAARCSWVAAPSTAPVLGVPAATASNQVPASTVNVQPTRSTPMSTSPAEARRSARRDGRRRHRGCGPAWEGPPRGYERLHHRSEQSQGGIGLGYILDADGDSAPADPGHLGDPLEWARQVAEEEYGDDCVEGGFIERHLLDGSLPSVDPGPPY